ncbi:type VI secretion system baseplate subunit TssK [Vibrio parahaemolyticus]|nr:type VI secretion system baseplate subunit TssK [Vibrio parahaemolyticus]HCG6766668.1 type VI secretion system baseplate subunit TssK [Vibrio parahaemolyticus]
MMQYSKTAWCEGMFLRPQHFQQHERAISNEFKGLHSLGGSYNWGVWNCRVKEHALKTGLIELDNLQAILPDMTLIDFSATTSFLSPLKVKKGTENTLVKVIVPLSKVSSKMIADPSETTVSRYLLQDLDVIDNLTGQDEETIQVASLNIELKSSNEQLTGYIELPILKIKEVSTEGEVILDDSYVPPLLNLLNDKVMTGYLRNAMAMTKIRADVIAQRLVKGKAASASAVDFIMLQMLNRYEAILKHFSELEKVHPLELATTFKGYIGELATFSHTTKRLPNLKAYDHLEVASVFAELNQVLSQYLSVVLDQTASKLPLEVRQYGIQVTPLPDKRLLESCQFVLAIKADTTTDEIRRLVPAQLKLGPAEQIRDLINNQINGINVAPLSVVPRQIPYQTGYVYFEVVKKGPFWMRLKDSGGIALHLSGHFPNPDIELWSINQ